MTERERLEKLAKELREAKIDFSVSGQGRKNIEHEKLILAGKIKAYRLLYKLTQVGLAMRLGLPKLQIIRWEGGKNMPSRMALEKLKTEGVI